MVFQCGADSIGGDLLGTLNLSVKGHGECLKMVKEWGLPMMVLGGGGYTIQNVSRCWTYETGICLGVDLENKLPAHDTIEYYGPDYELHLPIKNETNYNSQEYIDNITSQALENLKNIEIAPNVPF